MLTFSTVDEHFVTFFISSLMYVDTVVMFYQLSTAAPNLFVKETYWMAPEVCVDIPGVSTKFLCYQH
jgi:hypothetical protein